MINKKNITVPIFDAKVTVILTHSFKEIEEMYNLHDTDFTAAMVFKRGYRYFIAFERYEPGIIAHEIVHLVNHIFEDRGVELDTTNDEPQAYLTGYLYQIVHDILHYNFQ